MHPAAQPTVIQKSVQLLDQALALTFNRQLQDQVRQVTILAKDQGAGVIATNVASKLIPPRLKKPEPGFLSEDGYQRPLGGPGSSLLTLQP